jgi:hypothetical protein
LGGGKPMDLCSGGMIWSCCVDIVPQQQNQADENDSSQPGSLNNASECKALLSSYIATNNHYIQVTISTIIIFVFI